MDLTSLREVDELEVTLLMDNYTDLLLRQDTSVCRRPRVFLPDSLHAEHGFSCLVRARQGAREHKVLMDAAITPACLSHNASRLGVDLAAVDTFVLSHGHPDHALGLVSLLDVRNAEGKKTKLFVHPDAFLERRLCVPSSGPVHFPRIEESVLARAGAELVVSRGPQCLANGLIGMTGEVDRVTAFEKGFPGAEARKDGAWAPDPFRDDQGIVVKVKGKGIVVLSGCAHSGIINMVEQAKKLTATERVHAVMGGFHLTGPLFEPVIQPTVDEMKRIAPDHIAPMHCTGWKAINRFASEMPGQFVLNTVGTRYYFVEQHSA